jgi:hypothetical protein
MTEAEAILDWVTELAREVFARLEMLRGYVGRDVDPALLLLTMAIEEQLEEQRSFGARASQKKPRRAGQGLLQWRYPISRAGEEPARTSEIAVAGRTVLTIPAKELIACASVNSRRQSSVT